ncbi:MAG: PQQ-dependent sugar dehydrogenase, partial [Bacteroidota bacterium]
MFKALLHLKRRGLSAYFWLGTTFLLFSAFLPYAIQQHGLSNAEAIGAFLDGNMPTQTPSTTSSWTTQLVYPNLTFIDPIQLEELPGTQYFLMAGKAGHFWIFDKTDNNTNSKTQVLDISAKVKTSGDAGMMGFALHPEFNQSGSSNNEYIYVWYRYDYDPSYPGNLAYLRLSRFEFDLNTYIIDPSSEYVMIQQYDRHQWHNGGAMFFDDDGILYITVGDEGGANDQYNNGQKIDEGLLAGLLRIDVDNDLSRSHAIIRQPVNPANPPSGWPDSYSQGYTIPDDNPWLDPSGSHLEEFFAIGLRSPHRAALDQQTGNIFFGDIGQSTREEISIIEEGTNLQWPYREGFIAGPKAQPNPLIGVDTDPVYDYPRSVGNCVIGGFVYRGNKWNSILDGKYFFGDHGTRNIYLMSFDPSTGTPDVNYLTTVPAGGVGGKNGISAFATDSVGEIYVLKLYGTDLDGGQIYRLVPSSLTPEPPALLSQAGVFKNLNTLEPEDGLIPYELNVPFWSDGVEKFRWIALPNDGTHDSPGEQIGFSEEGDWNFPVGTVIVKHFEMPLDEANASLTKRLETRLLVHGSDGEYYGVSYRWNDAGTDAELLSDSWLDTLAISTPSNGDREVLWYYPSRQECLTCHTEAAGRVLGPKTRQFNKDILYPSSGVTANQL